MRELNLLLMFFIGLALGLETGPYSQGAHRLFLGTVLVYLALSVLIGWRKRKQLSRE